jgi:hypothetical protein
MVELEWKLGAQLVYGEVSWHMGSSPDGSAFACGGPSVYVYQRRAKGTAPGIVNRVVSFVG